MDETDNSIGSSGYFSDAFDTAIDGLGLGSGQDAVKTITKAVKDQFDGGAQAPTPALPTPAAPPKATFSALPTSVSTLLHNKYFGVSGEVLLLVGVGVVGFMYFASKRRR